MKELLAIYHSHRETRFDGMAARVHYGGHRVPVGGSWMPPAPHFLDSVLIVLNDGRAFSAELPEAWQSWTDAELEAQLPSCRVAEINVAERLALIREALS